jgi:hypothetical protein
MGHIQAIEATIKDTVAIEVDLASAVGRYESVTFVAKDADNTPFAEAIQPPRVVARPKVGVHIIIQLSPCLIEGHVNSHIGILRGIVRLGGMANDNIRSRDMNIQRDDKTPPFLLAAVRLINHNSNRKDPAKIPFQTLHGIPDLQVQGRRRIHIPIGDLEGWLHAVAFL